MRQSRRSKVRKQAQLLLRTQKGGSFRLKLPTMHKEGMESPAPCHRAAIGEAGLMLKFNLLV